MMKNMIVHGLWIKGPLSPMELLTMYSFIRCGHTFNLWTYESSPYPLPSGAIQRDAREIMEENEVFSYQFSNQFGHGQGSFAGFSDIFRYGLLHRHGGWWTDMDVTCLRRLDFEGPFVFRAMKDGKSAVGNLMYAEPGSELMGWCLEKGRSSMGPANRDWLLPVRILNEGIRKFQMENHIRVFTNPDSWPLVGRYLRQDAPMGDWMAFHWMNEEFRRLEIPKYKAIPSSTYGRLLKQHAIAFGEVDAEDMQDYVSRSGLWHYLKVSWKNFPSWVIQGRI